MTTPFLAFEDGLSVLDQNTMNALIAAQPSVLIFDGDQADAKGGAGTTENDLSANTYIARFTLAGQTTIGRVTLDLSAAGTGQDLTIEIRDNTFAVDGSDDGVLLRSVTVPAKILTTIGHGTISIPVDLTGLASGGTYWLRVNMAGDASNHNIWWGESSADTSYPTYHRSGPSGTWASGNALHFAVFAETPGTYQLTHSIWGTSAKTWVTDGPMSAIWRWCPGPDGTFVICDLLTPTLDANGYPYKWEVS